MGVIALIAGDKYVRKYSSLHKFFVCDMLKDKAEGIIGDLKYRYEASKYANDLEWQESYLKDEIAYWEEVLTYGAVIRCGGLFNNNEYSRHSCHAYSQKKLIDPFTHKVDYSLFENAKIEEIK